MLIKRIESENFGPFKGKQEVELNEGIYSVICEYEGDQRKSNRGGKTSFVEMILYGLYGITRSREEKKMIHEDTTEMQVSITCVDQDGEFTITRSRDDKNNGNLTLTGTEGSRKEDVQGFINAKLGITEDDFLLSFYFKQRDIDAFFNTKTTERKKILSRWFEKAYWRDYEEKAKAELKRIRDEIEKRRILIDQLSKDVVDINVIISDRDMQQELMKQSSSRLEAEEEKKSQLQSEFNSKSDTKVYDVQISSLQSEIKSLSEKFTMYMKGIAHNNSQISVILTELEEKKQNEAKLGEYEAELKQIPDDIEDKFAKAQKEKYGCIASLEAKKELLKKFDKFKGVCPVTQEECPSQVSMNGYKEQIQKEVQGLETKIGYYKGVEDRLEEKKSLYRELTRKIEVLKIRIQGCKTSIKKVDELKKDVETQEGQKLQTELDIKIIDGKIKELKQDKEESLNDTELVALREKLNNIVIEIGCLKSKIRDNQSKIAEAQARIKLYSENEKKVEVAQKEIAKFNKDLEDLTFIVYMFSDRGIVSIQIENSLEQIEEETNFILEKLGTNIQIEFQSQRELGTWEDNCLVCGTLYEKGERTHRCKRCGIDREKKKKDDLDVYILENGRRRAYEMDSGGGQTLICFAFRSAISKILQQSLNVRFNSIILDEILAPLDEVNAEEIVNVILHSLRNQFGFQQVFMISHKHEVQNSTDHLIKITRYPTENRSIYTLSED